MFLYVIYVERGELLDLNDIINRLKNGEIDALEILYNNMYVSLYAFALSIVKNKEAASDIIQDAFVQIYSKVSSFKKQTNARAWLYTIVRNLSIDYLRKQKKILRFTSDYDLSSNESKNGMDNLATYELLDDLDDVSCQIVLLYVFEGFKHYEIAEILHLKEGTVRWKYRKALNTLENKLRGDNDG